MEWISQVLFLCIAPVFFALGAVALWFSMTRHCDWRTRLQRFVSKSEFRGECWEYQSATLGGWSYRTMLSIGASSESLSIEVLGVFNQTHLVIPWSEVSFRRRWDFKLHECVELNLGREEQVSLLIANRLAERLRRVAGASWPERPRSG